MTWFWIVILTWRTPGGEASCSATGTLTPDQACAIGTRTAAYPAVVDAGRRAMGIPAGPPSTVLFFSIEPDALAAPVPEPARTAGGAS